MRTYYGGPGTTPRVEFDADVNVGGNLTEQNAPQGESATYTGDKTIDGDLTVTGAIIGGSGIQVAYVQFTDAQIKELPTTPRQLVAPPGAGKLIVPLFAELYFWFAGGAYTNTDTADAYLGVVWGADFEGGNLQLLVNTAGVEASLELVTQIGNHGVRLLPDTYGVDGGEIRRTIYPETSVGYPLYLWANNRGSGNYTGGNAANTLTVAVPYFITDVP